MPPHGVCVALLLLLAARASSLLPQHQLISGPVVGRTHNPLRHVNVQHARWHSQGGASAAHVEVVPTVLVHSGQWVTVTWGGLEDPTYDDFLAVYLGDADVTTSAPAKFKLCAAASEQHITMGSGATRCTGGRAVGSPGAQVVALRHGHNGFTRVRP